METEIVTVEIWSDVVCPWCYIGKRRFDRALMNLRNGSENGEALGEKADSIRVAYRAYQLDPQAPKGSSVPVRDVYARKFGGPERAQAIFDHLSSVAADDQIVFDFDIAQRANTVDAHRLLWKAGHELGFPGQSRLKDELLAAYFTNGQNIADHDVLGQAATRCWPESSTEDQFRAFLASDEGRGEVMQEMAEAATRGITGVPTYLIDGQWAIPGAQDTETFERVLRRVLERRGS